MKKKNLAKKMLNFAKKHLLVLCVGSVFLFMFFCDNFGGSIGKNLMDNLRAVSTSFTPTTDLFDDGSEVSFVSYLFGFSTYQKKESASFSLPTNQENISLSDDYLSYKYSGIIKSISDGKILATGYTQNGEKYVEIEHNEGYSSRYVGLEYIGASTGANLRRGNGVGMCSKEHICKVYIYKNSSIVKTSEILWQD